jgi:hypothetical protein
MRFGVTASPGRCSCLAGRGWRRWPRGGCGCCGLPAGVDVGLPGLVETVANGLELEPGDWLGRALAAAFLDTLVALGVAELQPPPPHPASSLRLGMRAST